MVLTGQRPLASPHSGAAHRGWRSLCADRLQLGQASRLRGLLARDLATLQYNSTKGRTIQDMPFQRYADEVDRRTNEYLDMYKDRKQLAEHPFGTVKRALGFSYFLTRRTESVKTESLMHFLAYNMKRAINIIGTKEIIGLLQE